MGASVGSLSNSQPFAKRLTNFLQDVDYRAASDPVDRQAIFRLRYECYRREDAISANTSRLFSDDYDAMDNCHLFGIHLDDELVASIRFHVISPEKPYGPAKDVFPDIVGPMINSGMTLIDPTRLVVDEEMSKRHPELPYATIRIAVMAAEHFEADLMFATVRKEHQGFYKRYFGCQTLCEPRPYPTLLKPISLMAGRPPELRDQLMERFPIFLSTFTERRLLFAALPDLLKDSGDDSEYLAPGALQVANG